MVRQYSDLVARIGLWTGCRRVLVGTRQRRSVCQTPDGTSKRMQRADFVFPNL